MFPIFPSLIVNVPLMHPELLLAETPAGVLNFWPGLPCTEASRTALSEPPFSVRKGFWQPLLPYTETEAAACLADLALLGQDGLGGTPLQAVAALQRPGAKGGLGAGEAHALSAFAKKGALFESTGEAQEALEASRRRAQALLLLAWLQEERVLDMRRLLSRYKAGAAALAAKLSEDSEAIEEGGAAALSDDTKDSLPADLAGSLPSWRFVLEQMAVFLPGEAAIYSADSRMAEELCEMDSLGESLTGIPEDCTLPHGWDEALRSALLYVHAPLWRVLGLTAPQPGKPWLDGSRFVVMYSKANKISA